MMLEAARVALYDATEAAILAMTPVVPDVQWDNRNLIDMGVQTDPFIAIEFIVGSGVQMSLGYTKVVRYTGMLAIVIMVREGEGISTSLKMADQLCPALQMRNIGGVVTQAAMPQKPSDLNGWHYRPIALPFWFDDIVVGP